MTPIMLQPGVESRPGFDIAHARYGAGEYKGGEGRGRAGEGGGQCNLAQEFPRDQ